MLECLTNKMIKTFQNTKLLFIVFHSDPKFDSNGCIICDLSINHSKDNLFAKFIEIATV